MEPRSLLSGAGVLPPRGLCQVAHFACCNTTRRWRVVVKKEDLSKGGRRELKAPAYVDQCRPARHGATAKHVLVGTRTGPARTARACP